MTTPEIHYYGAEHELNRLIKTHLFVICTNNSGSTFVKNVLATCPGAWGLRREGQHLFGFSGPTPLELGLPLLWASEQWCLDKLSDESLYNWDNSRRAWYFHAYARNKNASVLVEKSPPFMLHVKALKNNFTNAKFLFMVRNPYAVAEGILRSTDSSRYPSRKIAIERTSKHIINCLKYQKNNIINYGRSGLFFTYESMCEEPLSLQDKIINLVPELEELTLQQIIPVKGNYHEELRNMNSQQISRLSANDIKELDTLFSRHQELFEYYGYTIGIS